MRWILLLLFTAPFCAAADRRVPWTTGRVQGSPEPPLPCTTEPAFPSLEFSEALEMITVNERIFIVENKGRIWSFNPEVATPVKDLLLDLKALHPALDHAYGLAFHPRWRENGSVFVTYTVGAGLDDGTRLSRFRLTKLEPPELDRESEEVLLTWQSGGHNGASIHFGPDGMLYISTGDAEGPSPPDRLNTGQDNSDLLSAILRIDVDRRGAAAPYEIPKDNPFIGKPDVRPEIWAFGFRNPWKISFDSSGRLWCGDVGWELWEMIHLVQRGGNHGWSAMEASQPLKPETLSDLAPITPPVIAHPHTEAASITGGYVYEGTQLPELRGAYIYGDYETGKIWALWHDGEKVTRHDEIADTPHKIATFGIGPDGEIYGIHWGAPASIHRLARHSATDTPSRFPRRLSETGLFSDVATLRPAPGVYDFTVREPMWQDGAAVQRFIALPGSSAIQAAFNRRRDGTIANPKVTWPLDSVLVRNIATRGEAARNLETQMLHFNGESWNGYSYRWNEAGTDAELADADGGQGPASGTDQPHRIHSRAECVRCHTPWAGFALGFQPQQLLTIAGEPASDAAARLGLTESAFFELSKARLARSSDPGTEIEERARSWLHANCAHCHRQHGGGSVAIKVNAELPLAETLLVGEKPVRGDMGITDARVIAPGAPWRSVLINRLARTGNGHMPMIGASTVDEHGLSVLWDWITQLGTGETNSGAHPFGAATRTEDAALEKELNDSAREGIGSQKLDRLIRRAEGDPALAMRLLHHLRLKPQPESSAPVHPALVSLAKSSDENVAVLFERFLPPGQRVATIGTAGVDAAQVLSLEGSAARGRDLLSPAGRMAICLACHFIHGTGRDFGPDLSRIGGRLTPEQILESLALPAKSISPGFAAFQAELKDGTSHAGFVAAQDENAVTLKLMTGQALTLRRGELLSLKPLPGSLMPEHLLQALTLQQAADLVAYLASLK